MEEFMAEIAMHLAVVLVCWWLLLNVKCQKNAIKENPTWQIGLLLPKKVLWIYLNSDKNNQAQQQAGGMYLL